MADPVEQSPLRQRVDQRLLSLETRRLSWWNHWRELAEYIFPRRYKWLIAANELNRGTPLNGRIIDNTGTVAARILSAGMMAGITSPARPWFKLRIEGVDQDESNPINIWLAECERRMQRVMQESNFYNSMAVLFADLAVFGTGTMLIYEDYDDVIRCYNPCAGEYYLENGPRLAVNVFYRKFTYTVSQIVERWGLENCSDTVKTLYSQANNVGLQTEIIIGHALEPNEPAYPEVPASFKYRECYWEWGTIQNQKTSGGPNFLECKGFHEIPGIFPRWDIVGNDAYGRGPAMDALGDIKQLQQETRRKAQALDKLVNPPLLADVQLKNQPMSLLPGGVNYVSGLNKTEGMRPIYQVMPPIREIMEDILQVQRRIQNTFYNDLFMMFQQMQAEPRSAAAVDARREEKLVMLGPVLERFENEGLDPAIDRIFNIMVRSNLLPPPPPEIQKAPIQVVYVSMLAEAQRAVATAGIERTFAFAGNLAAVAPDIMDNLDADEAIKIYGDQMQIDPRILRNEERIAQIRQQRLQQQQQIQQMEVTSAAVQGAKTLSDTEVGGGRNALEAMLQ